MSYIKNDFMLDNKFAVKLYEYAREMPIFDYHCHLSEKQILENKQFKDLADIWLGGDHYKWRLMRFYGVDEDLITGNAAPIDKFAAYVEAVSKAFGNPLQHWSQLELKTFFGIEDELRPENTMTIWNKANAFIESKKLTPLDCILQSNVKYLFTTNEAYDDLETFEKIKRKNLGVAVLPAFRADKLMAVEASDYRNTIDRLAELTLPVKDLGDLETAVKIRLAEFKKVGCRAADIATEQCYPQVDRKEAEAVFIKAIKGKRVEREEGEAFRSYMTEFLLELYAKEGIVAEYHLGAMRNNNSVAFEKIGADSGFDTIGGGDYIYNLSCLMDRLNQKKALPKMILFNLNPNRNAEFIALSGCFCDGTARGKINYGAAWWFLDNKPGMEQHLTDLCALGNIDTFLGMLTDSRSFLSYPRHDYFRRILCNFFGKMISDGLMTDDVKFAARTVQNICFYNAEKFFGMDNLM